MFDKLTRQPDDPLLALIGLYRADVRTGKVDLGVGVYRDEQGATPIFRAVKAAERRLLENQATKSYVGPEGDPVFVERLWELAAGAAGRERPTAGVQTPGGSGAVRLAADLLVHMGVKRIWLGVPTWPNHPAIFKAAGLAIATHPYFDVPSQAILFEQMTEALAGAEAGDAVLLHASCHNPSGGVLSAEQWTAISALFLSCLAELASSSAFSKNRYRTRSNSSGRLASSQSASSSEKSTGRFSTVIGRRRLLESVSSVVLKFSLASSAFVVATLR